MSIPMNGELANEGTTDALTALFKSQTPYIRFATATISDTDTLATITECTAIVGSSLASVLGTASVDGVTGKSTLKNTSDFTSNNATIGGQEIKAWYIATAATGTTGRLLAFGNKGTDSIFTNVGSPITIANGDLVITID